MFKHRKSKVALLPLIAVLFVVLQGSSCRADYTKQDATTTLKLLDVTSGGAGKYGLTTESYWRNPGVLGITIRCFHNQDFGSGLTDEPKHCGTFPNPTLLHNSAYLLAVNEGSGQVTQSVWLSNNGRMYICNHNRTAWTDATGEASNCMEFPRPVQVGNFAILISINSGSGIIAQSFWQNLDSSVTICDHNQDSTGFLGFGGLAFGSVRSCSKMAIPSNLFPEGLVNPKLQAITSGANRPWESYWQDANGIVVQCKHDQTGDFFASHGIGAATECYYWKAAQPGDVGKSS